MIENSAWCNYNDIFGKDIHISFFLGSVSVSHSTYMLPILQRRDLDPHLFII